uniref:Uncharacterized protein n=1 Tax=Oryza meridionalis TaxID=40149 RepID=A0A0E0ESD9_9ORYZ
MPAMACGARAGATAFPSPSTRHARAPRPPGRFRALVPAPPAPRLGLRRLPPPMASTIDSPGSSSDFAKRMERAWLISQQPRPIPCSSCQSAGHVECKWCTGTGFFILGNNMLASQLVLIAKELGFVPSGLRILLSTNEAEEVYHTIYAYGRPMLSSLAEA